MSKAVMIVGIIVLLLGLFYVGAPHPYHVASGIGFGWEHNMHQILGVILIIVGAIALWKGRK